MTEDEKQAQRDSFAGKPVSQMTPEERAVFDADFQYGFGLIAFFEAPCTATKPFH